MLGNNEHVPLSGLFYVADQQFQTVYNASLKSDEAADDAHAESVSVTPIDRATVLAMLRKSFPDRRLSKRDAADLAEELRAYGFTDLAEVERFGKVVPTHRPGSEQRHVDAGRLGECHRAGETRVDLEQGWPAGTVHLGLDVDDALGSDDLGHPAAKGLERVVLDRAPSHGDA